MSILCKLFGHAMHFDISDPASPSKCKRCGHEKPPIRLRCPPMPKGIYFQEPVYLSSSARTTIKIQPQAEAMTKESAQLKLTELHNAVMEAIEARDAFIEDNKHLFAEFPIGQKVVNIEDNSTGVVISHSHDTYGDPARQGNSASFNVACKIEYTSRMGVTRVTNILPHGDNHPWRAVEL